MKQKIENFFYKYMSGEWESVTKIIWLYVHISIFIITGLIGYLFAEGKYIFAICILPIPIIYLYKRYEKARTYKVQYSEQ